MAAQLGTIVNGIIVGKFIKIGVLETPSFSYGEENAPLTSYLYIF